MKVLHVIPSLSPKHGGPSVALPLMARSLVAQGVQVDVATTDDDGPGSRMNVPLNQRVETEGYGVFYFRKQTEFYKVSLPFGRWLAAHVMDYDLIHIHALFSCTSNCAARQARKQNVPYIVRPLGVLNRWGMENRRRLVKSLSFQFVEQPILRHAAAMHYTSEQERLEAEAVGAMAKPFVIPLGIDLAPFAQLPDVEVFLHRHPSARGKKLVLFLSRLDAKKGLDLLIEAWAKIRKSEIRDRRSGADDPSSVLRSPPSDWLLVIAGNGDAEFERALRAQAERLGVADAILWTGFLGGQDKLSALNAASLFVLPSYSENFGIALVEAMAAGLPCLTTPGVALAEDVQARAANVLMVVPAEVNPLASALDQLMSDAALRAQLGANARSMATEHFSMTAMGANLKKLYENLFAAK